MISRTAAVTSIVLVLVMIAATLWRLAMLPDWAYGPNGAPPPMRNSLVMFVPPACVGFVGAVLALRKWLTTASADAVAPWQRWGSHALVAYGMICTLFHLYIVVRSAGFAGSFSPALAARTIDVLAGCLLIVFANQMPKLPPLPARFRFGQLDPQRFSFKWDHSVIPFERETPQIPELTHVLVGEPDATSPGHASVRGSHLLRFVGRFLVLSGLAIVIGALVMPPPMMLPLALSVTTTVALAVVVRKVQLLREQSHERLGRGS